MQAHGESLLSVRRMIRSAKMEVEDSPHVGGSSRSLGDFCGAFLGLLRTLRDRPERTPGRTSGQADGATKQSWSCRAVSTTANRPLHVLTPERGLPRSMSEMA